MRDGSSDLGVEIRRTEWKPRFNVDGRHEVLELAVFTVNPQSRSRNSREEDDSLVGDIPITEADTPCSRDLLDAELVTVVGDRVTAYYSHDDALYALVWRPDTDEWRCEERPLGPEGFDPESSTLDDDESVVWEREGGGAV